MAENGLSVPFRVIGDSNQGVVIGIKALTIAIRRIPKSGDRDRGPTRQNRENLQFEDSLYSAYGRLP
ncbi:hypothetical protein CRG98_031395 [Punica granatum]|uniref:Uncharacterized protein n=1 Tax=Punica granatum TaxID=22663 RepID=A0A2I0IW36_PUNGR|nr:hypothetical protein CRG98_031395 [Punica granatum]